MDNVKVVPELTNYKATATFYDEAGEAITPTGAVTYRVIDATTGTVVVPETPVVVTSSTVSIVVAAAYNTCITPNSRKEYRQLVVKAVGLAQVEHLYRVERVPAPTT